MTRLEPDVRAGAKLRRIRGRRRLRARDVERVSMDLARQRKNPYLSFSRTWITDIETGRFVPGSFKMASLAEIYGMDLDEIHKLYNMSPDITVEHPVYRPPKTQLLKPREESKPRAADHPANMRIEDTNLLTGIVDIWGS